MSKVMLIEDDATMRGLLSTLLEMEGFDVLPWDGDGDVISSLRRYRPDVVLLDVNLKGQSGFDVLKQIRQDESLTHCRVVMSSGMDYGEKSLELGADGFIMKPYIPDDLVALIKKNLDQ